MTKDQECKEGHHFICTKCGIDFDDRIKELGDDGVKAIMRKLQDDI